MSDMFDALLGNGQIDPAELAQRLRGQQQMGTIASLTGIPGLQKLGPQMINQAAQGAQDYATLDERKQNQGLQRSLQALQIENAAQVAKQASLDRAATRTDSNQRSSDERALRQSMLDQSLAAKTDAAKEKADLAATAGAAKDEASYNLAADSLDSLKASAQQLLDHPGLSRIVGLQGHIFNLPGSDAANAAALLDNIKNKVVIGTMLGLKQASRTGSTGFGPLSEKEGARLENSVVPLSQAQDETSMRAALKALADYADNSKARLKAGLTAAHPAASAGRTITRTGKNAQGQRVAQYSDGAVEVMP